MTDTAENLMLSKLRVKFVALICGVTALILAASFSFIVWAAHNQEVKAVYVELSTTAESTYTKMPHDAFGPRGEFNPQTPRIGGRLQVNAPFPIAVYFIDGRDGTGIPVDGSTATIADDVLESALEFALNSPSEQGLVESADLFFLRSQRTNGDCIIAFADKQVAGDALRLVKPLVPVGLAIMVLVFVLAWFFSRWALRPVQEAWSKQQQFIADASHEMKTPLTVILANAAIALKKPQATVAEQSQWIEGIQDEAQNMEQLVLDMLALAQPINASGSSSAFEPVSLTQLAQRASLQFEAVAFERGLLVDDNVESDVTILGDTTQLQRMIGTLVDNAIKYATADSTISITLKSAGQNGILSVHNWGDPIDPNDLPHVFARFYRSDKSRDRSTEEGSHSFGLGLAIAQKIATQHGGTLTVTSSEAEGTTFTACFPLA